MTIKNKRKKITQTYNEMLNGLDASIGLVKVLKLKKKNIRANYKLKIDLRKLKGSSKLNWEPQQVWTMYPNPKDKSLCFSWWERFLCWLGFKRCEWYMRRVYKTLDEIKGINDHSQ